VGAYDGTWNVVFATRAGNCSATNSVPFAVSGMRVLSAGGGKVTGGIGRNGVVSVAISVGLSHASGSAGLWAIMELAAGPESSPATAAAASGRRRGASVPRMQRMTPFFTAWCAAKPGP